MRGDAPGFVYLVSIDLPLADTILEAKIMLLAHLHLLNDFNFGPRSPESKANCMSVISPARCSGRGSNLMTDLLERCVVLPTRT